MIALMIAGALNYWRLVPLFPFRQRSWATPQDMHKTMRSQIHEALVIQLVELKAPGAYPKEQRDPYRILKAVDAAFYRRLEPVLRKAQAGGVREQQALMRMLARKIAQEKRGREHPALPEQDP